MTERVRFEIGDDRVGVVLLDRPDKLNAMDRELFAGLHEAAGQARGSIDAGACGAVLVTGAGRAFSSGLDVSLFGEVAGAGFSDESIAWLQEAFTVFEDLSVPVVAGVRGVAVGGGCQLALACHLRVAAPDARFGLLETRWGIVPDLGATYRLPRLIGLSRAIDLGISAREVDAATALRWGMVDAVLEDDDFAGAVRAWVAALASGPSVATGAVPRLMRESLARSRDDALAAERAAQQRCLGSADFQEAVRAALEGRAPRFRGN